MANEKRLIDANALIAEYDRVHIGPPGGARKLMEDAPTVDAVEVCRCKDCKYYDNSEGIQWCHLNSKFFPGGADWHSFPEDGFCSYGERRTDES
jgi:hypothetical protein